MFDTTGAIDAERAAVHTRLGRRQRLVVGLDHTFTALYYASALVVFATVALAILSGTSEHLWVVGFGAFGLPQVFDDELTDRLFGRAFDRDHGLLLALDFAELMSQS